MTPFFALLFDSVACLHQKDLQRYGFTFSQTTGSLSASQLPSHGSCIVPKSINCNAWAKLTQWCIAPPIQILSNKDLGWARHIGRSLGTPPAKSSFLALMAQKKPQVLSSWHRKNKNTTAWNTTLETIGHAPTSRLKLQWMKANKSPHQGDQCHRKNLLPLEMVPNF